MDFQELTPKEEELLKEILSHCNDDGTPDNGYWRDCFRSIKGQDELDLRSRFGSLKQKGILAIPYWPDGIPYIQLTSYADEYFSEKERYNREKKKEKNTDFRRDIIVAILGAIAALILEHIENIYSFLKSLF